MKRIEKFVPRSEYGRLAGDEAAVWLKMKQSGVIFLSANNTDKTVTVIVRGTKYEYWLGDAYHFWPSQRKLIVKYPWKVLTWLKRHSHRYVKL